MRRFMIVWSAFLVVNMVGLAFLTASEGNAWRGVWILLLTLLPFLNVMFWSRISFVEIAVVNVMPTGEDNDETKSGEA